MGGRSSSSNATHNYTNTTNKSNSAAFNGDMSGHVISGIENSNISVTDRGAVNAALRAMSDTTKNAFWFGEEAIAANEAVTRDVIDSNERVSMGVIDFSSDVVRDALTQSERGTEMALDVASNISRDTSNATNQDAVKYMALAGVAMSVAVAFRGGR